MYTRVNVISSVPVPFTSVFTSVCSPVTVAIWPLLNRMVACSTTRDSIWTTEQVKDRSLIVALAVLVQIQVIPAQDAIERANVVLQLCDAKFLFDLNNPLHEERSWFGLQRRHRNQLY